MMAGKENENKKLKLMTVPGWENILVQKITSKNHAFFSPQVLEIHIKIIQSENWLLVLKIIAIYIHSYKLYLFFITT